MFLADFFCPRIHVWRTDGTFVRSWGSGGRGPGELGAPLALGLRADELFVADIFNHRVSVFRASDGAFLRAVGVSELRKPTSVALSATGEVFVTDPEAGRVCVFRGSDGALLRTIEWPNSLRVAVCGGEVLVVDLRGRVNLFRSSDGVFLRSWSLANADVSSLAVTAAGEVLVSFHREAGPQLRVYRLADGKFLRDVGFVCGVVGHVAVGARGELVLARCGTVRFFE